MYVLYTIHIMSISTLYDYIICWSMVFLIEIKENNNNRCCSFIIIIIEKFDEN